MKHFILNKLIITLFLTISFSGVFAQANVDSPYSMFGVGQVRNKTMNARLKSMGGVASAMCGKNMLNAGNPASYAQIDTLSFLFDAGFYVKSSTFSTSSLSEKALNASFDYVAMGFAPTRWWKVALGAQPYSNVGYHVVTSFDNETVGRYNETFQGDGGLNQAFIGNAFCIGEHFSVGANVHYVFGDSRSTTTLSWPDSTYTIGSRRSRDIMVSSFMFDYGLMFHGKINSGLFFCIGATYDQKVNLRGTQTIFVRSIETSPSDSDTYEYLIDTVFFDKNKNAKLTMPHGFGLGFSLHKNNRWTIGADFNWNNWSAFARNGVNEGLQDSWRVALGGELMPASTSISNYWTRMSYRLGGFFEKTFLLINGQPINKIGVSAGVTLPFPRSQSSVNLGLEVGKCGTKSAGLIQENYVNLTVGVSINERWFIKRKYN